MLKLLIDLVSNRVCSGLYGRLGVANSDLRFTLDFLHNTFSLQILFAEDTPSGMTEALDSLSNGRKVSTMVDGAKRFYVVLRLADQDRTTAGAVFS